MCACEELKWPAMRSSNNFAAQVKRLTSPGEKEKEKEEQAEMLLWAEEREMRKKAGEGKRSPRNAARKVFHADALV